jgi:hypothetical protein
VPSKASGAWLAAAVLDAGHGLLEKLECNLRLDAQLSALPLSERVRKTTREYRARATRISEAWALVRQRCSQAERFSNEVAAATS